MAENRKNPMDPRLVKRPRLPISAQVYNGQPIELVSGNGTRQLNSSIPQAYQPAGRYPPGLEQFIQSFPATQNHHQEPQDRPGSPVEVAYAPGDSAADAGEKFYRLKDIAAAIVAMLSFYLGNAPDQ